jgi:hypothetical protein
MDSVQYLLRRHHPSGQLQPIVGSSEGCTQQLIELVTRWALVSSMDGTALHRSQRDDAEVKLSHIAMSSHRIASVSQNLVHRDAVPHTDHSYEIIGGCPTVSKGRKGCGRRAKHADKAPGAL